MEHPLRPEEIDPAIRDTLLRHIAMAADLMWLHHRAPQQDATGAVIIHRVYRQYLSVLHYPWSGFAEWAFRFPTAKAAHDFINKHQLNAVVKPSWQVQEPEEEECYEQAY
jgi:hypothetical protein